MLTKVQWFSFQLITTFKLLATAFHQQPFFVNLTDEPSEITKKRTSTLNMCQQKDYMWQFGQRVYTVQVSWVAQNSCDNLRHELLKELPWSYSHLSGVVIMGRRERSSINHDKHRLPSQLSQTDAVIGTARCSDPTSSVYLLKQLLSSTTVVQGVGKSLRQQPDHSTQLQSLDSNHPSSGITLAAQSCTTQTP